ncbi:hypothetical protein EMCRGX_G025298 [Ephydatia muelleri]
MEEVQSKYDYMFRIVTVGDYGVGKSSLVTRMAKNEYNPSNIPTIGIDFALKTIEIEGRRIKTQLWDSIGGRNRVIQHPTLFYRSSMGIFLIYDTTSENSFKSLECYITDIEEDAPPNCVKMILGSKCDLAESRAVSTELGKELAAKHGYRFMEVSAKTGHNAEQALLDLAKDIMIGIDSRCSESHALQADSAGNKKGRRCF